MSREHGTKEGDSGQRQGVIKSNKQDEEWETRQDAEIEQDNGQYQGLRIGRDLDLRQRPKGLHGFLALEERQKPSKDKQSWWHTQLPSTWEAEAAHGKKHHRDMYKRCSLTS